MARCYLCALMLLLLLLLSCSKPESSAPRAELRKVDATHVAVVPAVGQLPYCLVYAAGPEGTVRLLAVAEDGMSIACEAREPIVMPAPSIPSNNDAIRFFVLFSDRKVQAKPLAEQIRECIANHTKKVTIMDLRVPGQATLETIEMVSSNLREL